MKDMIFLFSAAWMGCGNFVHDRPENPFFRANHRIFLQVQEEYAILTKYEFTS